MPRAVRTQFLSIEMPKPGSEQWIRCVLQFVDYDEQGEVTHISGRADELHRRMNEVAPQVVTFTDPLTGQIHTMTMAGVAAGVRASVIEYYLEQFPGSYYDDDLDHVVLP